MESRPGLIRGTADGALPPFIRPLPAGPPFADSVSRELGRLALAPLGLALTDALRRAARVNPDAFARLGAYREAVFIIAPVEAPVDFILEPLGAEGRITAVPRYPRRACAARISGPLLQLLGVFDGSLDADSAFFRRQVRVQGDMEAMTALHNVMDSAEFQIIDLLPAPAALRSPLGRVLSSGAGFARRVLERAQQT